MRTQPACFVRPVAPRFFRRYIRYGEDGEELYNLREDPNEWHNLASEEKYADLKAKMRKSAPKTFAEPEGKLNSRKDLVIEGETFRWEKGKGNYKPLPKHLPYASAGVPASEKHGEK